MWLSCCCVGNQDQEGDFSAETSLGENIYTWRRKARLLPAMWGSVAGGLVYVFGGVWKVERGLFG